LLDICAAGEDPDLDKLRAVHRLVENHEAVVKFAARGCGQQGSPPVNAPLSDPNAKPGMQYVDAVDAGQSLIQCSLVGPALAADKVIGSRLCMLCCAS